MSTRRRRDRGFTLVEMMVVIVIIGILAAVIIVNIAGKGDKAKVTATQAIVKQVDQQVELFKLNHNEYPRALDDLVSQPSYVDSKNYRPYLKEPARDGWGREFLFRVPGTDGHPFDIVSLGADGKEGGQGFDEDIWNHARK